jgi:hypothetical protein
LMDCSEIGNSDNDSVAENLDNILGILLPHFH